MTVGESFAVLDPKSSSLKTVQYSFIKDFEQFSDNLPAQGTMQSGKLFHAKGSACPTCENDFLSLPTPTKSDAKRLIEFKVRSLVKSFLRKQKGNSFFNPNLTEIVAGLIGIKPSAAFLIWMMGTQKHSLWTTGSSGGYSQPADYFVDIRPYQRSVLGVRSRNHWLFSFLHAT